MTSDPYPPQRAAFSLHNHLLRRAGESALRDNTSVNALVRDALTRHVDGRSRRLEALAAFEAVAQRSTSSNREPWERAALDGLGDPWP